MSLQELELSVDHVPEGVLVADVATGNVRTANVACCAMLNCDESTLVGATLSELAVGRPGSVISDERLQQARRDGSATFDWQVKVGAGGEASFEVQLTTTTCDSRELAVLSLRERSGRGAVDSTLERGRDRYRTLFDNDDLVLWEQDFSAARAYATELAETGEELGAYLEANPDELLEILGRMEVDMVNDAALDFYGVDSKEELVANFGEMMVPDTRKGLTAMWKAIVDGERYFCTECKFQPLDSEEVKYELMEVYVPEAHTEDYSLVFTTATDITDQKERERELEAAKERYRGILDRSSDYVLVHTAEGEIDYVSPGIETTLGYDPAELVGTDTLEYVHPDDRDNIRDTFEEILANPETDVNVEYRVRAADGSYRWVEARGGNYLDDPLIGGIMVTIRDIVERKQSEQALRAERDARSTLQRELANTISVDAFASTMCAELVAMDAVTLAQVGAVTATDHIELLAADGPDGSHDSFAVPDSDDPVVTTVLAENDTGPTRFPVAGSESQAGGRTGVVVPILHNSVTRGVLVAHLAAERQLSDERVCHLLQESADVLGYAMASDEHRRALAADEWVQLTATVETRETPLSRIVETTDTPATVDAVFPRRDDTVLCHLTVDGDPAAFVERAQECNGIKRIERVGDERLQAVVAESTPSTVVADHGARLDEATVGPESTTMQVRFPEAAALDPVLEALTTQFEDAVVREFTTNPTDHDRADPLSELTNRQREVLEAAYHSGYFEKPRRQNASEVAEELDIARPTYDEVLRAAQRNLLADVFNEA